MLTFTSQRNLFGSLTGNTSSSNLTLCDTLCNQFAREIVSSRPWNFRETTNTITAVSNQQFYDLPYDFGTLQHVTVTSGTTIYSPRKVTSREQWDRINSTSGYTSNAPEYYFIFGDQIGFYPILSSADLTITVSYLKRQRDLSVADYTTGTITTATNGDETITGNGTSWTSAMVGRYMKIDESGAGDGFWYKIASVTDTTHLELDRPYEGTNIAAGSATYTIGQTYIIPEDFQIIPLYRTLELYFTSVQPESERANQYKILYTEGLKRMQGELGGKDLNPQL